MRNLFRLLPLALLGASAMAATPLQQVVVSYPKDTPDSVVEEAKDAIKKAGGAIVHEYNIIKGFAANAPAAALEMIHSLGSDNDVVIESDEEVKVWSSPS